MRNEETIREALPVLPSADQPFADAQALPVVRHRFPVELAGPAGSVTTAEYLAVIAGVDYISRIAQTAERW